MKLIDRIEAFKKKVPDRTSYKFKNGMEFKGHSSYTLHWWIDKLYKDSVNEWNTFKTQNTADFMKKFI